MQLNLDLLLVMNSTFSVMNSNDKKIHVHLLKSPSIRTSNGKTKKSNGSILKAFLYLPHAHHGWFLLCTQSNSPTLNQCECEWPTIWFHADFFLPEIDGTSRKRYPWTYSDTTGVVVGKVIVIIITVFKSRRHFEKTSFNSTQRDCQQDLEDLRC